MGIVVQVVVGILQVTNAMAALALFSRGSLRNINDIKSKTKVNLNILTSQKKKKKNQINEFFLLPYMIFYILKSLHDIFIINSTSYIFFNVHSQTIIHPLISHLID